MTRIRSKPTRKRQENHKDYSSELRNGVRKVGEGVKDMANVAGEAARANVDPIDTYVRKFPLRAMLMAAGAGALIGVLFLRK